LTFIEKIISLACQNPGQDMAKEAKLFEKALARLDPSAERYAQSLAKKLKSCNNKAEARRAENIIMTLFYAAALLLGTYAYTPLAPGNEAYLARARKALETLLAKEPHNLAEAEKEASNTAQQLHTIAAVLKANSYRFLAYRG
jgi:hypothetical protein